MSYAYKVQKCGDVCLDACSNIQVRKSQNADSVHLKKGQLSFLLRANKLLLYLRNLWSICKHIETWIKLFWLLSQPKSRLLGLNDSNWELMSESHFNSAETWPNHKPWKPLISSKNSLSLIGPESSIKHHVIWSLWLPLTVSSNTWAAAGRENTCSVRREWDGCSPKNPTQMWIDVCVQGGSKGLSERSEVAVSTVTVISKTDREPKKLDRTDGYISNKELGCSTHIILFTRILVFIN